MPKKHHADHLTTNQTIANARLFCFEALKNSTENPALEASILISLALEIPREKIFSLREKTLSTAELEKISELLNRRIKNEPIAYIKGEKEFFGRSFLVSNATLIPRPDSEILIEAALKAAESQTTSLKICDLGTGSGCLLLTLLAELKNASGIGVDISAAALEIAEKNAKNMRLSARSKFIESNWFAKIPTEENGNFNFIIANPPYIKISDAENLSADIYQHEPHKALFSGTDGLDSYRKIIPELPKYLKKSGLVFFEIGQGQENELIKILEAHKLNPISSHKDYGNITRVISATIS